MDEFLGKKISEAPIKEFGVLAPQRTEVRATAVLGHTPKDGKRKGTVQSAFECFLKSGVALHFLCT